MNRGSVPRLLQKRLRDQASMRPRFMNRGSLIQLCMDFGDVKASMRPRFMNRGSISIQPVLIRSDLLQ